jgi:hypothetical protein
MQAVLCCVCFVLLLACPRLTQASQRVEVEFAAPDPERNAVRAALVEALARVEVAADIAERTAIDVSEVVTRKVELEPPLARIWIDLTGANDVAVYVADRAWERIFIRLVPRSDNPAVNHEQVAEIVSAAAQALSEGATIGIERSQARAHLLPPPAAAPRRELPPRRSSATPAAKLPRVWVGLGYEALHHSDRMPVVHGPTVELGATFAGFTRADVGVMLSAVARPGHYVSNEVAARFDTLAVRWLVVASSPGHRWLRMRAALGPGFDVVHLQPERAAHGLEPTAKRTLLFGVLRGAAGIELDVAHVSAGRDSRLAGCLLFFADLELTDTRYVLSAPKAEKVAFDPFRVQPGLALLLLLR